MSDTVGPGGIVGAKVLWRNNRIVAASPSFSYGVRQATTDWYEGIAVKSASVMPNNEGEVDVTCPIPADWESGAVDARVTIEDLPEIQWEGSNIYQIGEITPTPPPTPDVLSEMLPLIMMVMLMAMIQPMMEGMANETSVVKG